MPHKDPQKRKEYYKKYHKIWYTKNKTKRVHQISERKMKSKEWLFNYKSTLSCSKCGISNPIVLDFHHKDPKTKSFEIASGITDKSIDTMMEEIAKCDVLCANCHRIEHYKYRALYITYKNKIN